MNHHERAVAAVQKSMDNILKGEAMPNLPDDVTDKDVSDAGEAIPATDDEIIAFVQRALPKAEDVDIDESTEVGAYMKFWLNRGDVER